MKKYQLIVGDNKLLGTLIFIKDTKERTSMKLVFAQKIQNIGIFENAERQGKIDDTKLFSAKLIPKGATLEMSYKFANKKLELKIEMKMGSIERTFYDVEIPANCPLFMLRINQLDLYPIATPKEDALFITKNLKGPDFAICLSFEADNGNPWCDLIQENKTRIDTQIPIPELVPNKVYVLATDDKNIPKGVKMLSIWIPEKHKSTKST